MPGARRGSTVRVCALVCAGLLLGFAQPQTACPQSQAPQNQPSYDPAFDPGWGGNGQPGQPGQPWTPGVSGPRYSPDRERENSDYRGSDRYPAPPVEIEGDAPSPNGPVVNVVELRVVGNRQVTASAIGRHVQTRPGRPFDERLIAEDKRDLMQTEWFREVTVRAKSTPDGVVVIYEVVERPLVTRITFLGNDRIARWRLVKKLKLKTGDAISPSKVEQVRQELVDFYREKGFAQATVRTIQGNEEGDREVAFLIHEGPKQRVSKTNFVGNTIVSDGRLRTQITSKPPILFLFKGELNKDKIESDVASLLNYYRMLGFFQAKVSRELTSGANQDWTEITFVIDEGPRSFVRNVVFQGNTKYTSEQLAAELKLTKDKPFNRNELERDKIVIEEKYGELGHVFARIDPVPQFEMEPGKIDLVYKIAEGASYRVGRIDVQLEGDYPHTRRNTVLNRISLHPGDIVDTRQLRASERRLKASTLFVNDPATGNEPRIVFNQPDPTDENQVAQRPPDGSGFRGQSPDGEEVRWLTLTVHGELLPEEDDSGDATIDDESENDRAFEESSAEHKRIPSANGAPSRPRREEISRPRREDISRPRRANLIRFQSPTEAGQAPLGRTGPFGLKLDRDRRREAPAADSRPSRRTRATETADRRERDRDRLDEPDLETRAPRTPGYSGFSDLNPDLHENRPWGDRSDDERDRPVIPRRLRAQSPGAYDSGRGAAGGSSPRSSAGYGGRTRFANQRGPSDLPADDPNAAGFDNGDRFGGRDPGIGADGDGVGGGGLVGDGFPPYGLGNGSPDGGAYDPLFPRFNPFVDLNARASETTTGRFMAGVNFNSNGGFFGNIVLEEQNFDITRIPTSWEDIRNATAFRGRGQRFRIEAIPGTVFSRYQVSFEEPYLFDSMVQFGTSASFFKRQYRDWREERLGGRFSLGYNFPENQDLSASVSLRAENVNINTPRTPTPPELQRVLGNNALYSVLFNIRHDTRDSPFLATEGHRISLGYEQVFGDFDYPRFTIEANQYWKIRERPDGSGRHVFSLGTNVGFSGKDTPIFENFFAGGISSLRGFFFRAASPRNMGVIVGGRFQFLNTAEYMFPLTADDSLRALVFCDFGTVEQSITIHSRNFRVSPGIGLRISIPALGPQPLGFDFSVPVAHADGDQIQNFTIAFGYNR